MPDISVEYLGLKLASPVVAAPSGTTGTCDLMKVAEDNGVGAFVMRSLYAPGSDASAWPHFELIRRGLGAMRSGTLYSTEHASLSDADRYAEEIRKCKEHCHIPIIASIGCLTSGCWIDLACLVEQAGANAVELHMVSPNKPRESLSVEDMAEITRSVKSSVSIPVVAKMTPQLENPALAAIALEQAGANAVVMFDRFTGLEIDIDSEQPAGGRGYAWHGGPWSIFYCLRWVSAAAPELTIPIAGCGGVTGWEDVVKYILAGATVAQAASAIMAQGYSVVKAYNQGLSDWMERKGYASLADFRGKVAAVSGGS